MYLSLFEELQNINCKLETLDNENILITANMQDALFRAYHILKVNIKEYDLNLKITFIFNKNNTVEALQITHYIKKGA